jgi:hypothetical protein
MAGSIVQIIASILAYLSARGVDMLLGKWAAYVVIAWEKVVSQSALEQFRQTRNDLVKDMPDKWKEWEKWRDSIKVK